MSLVQCAFQQLVCSFKPVGMQQKHNLWLLPFVQNLQAGSHANGGLLIVRRALPCVTTPDEFFVITGAIFSLDKLMKGQQKHMKQIWPWWLSLPHDAVMSASLNKFSMNGSGHVPSRRSAL